MGAVALRATFYSGTGECLTKREAAPPPRSSLTSRPPALGNNSSYSAQLLHGTDYWRTVLDGACDIDIYGHNGVSVADIDNDGFDDLYICQPAGLPNRLYRNRGDGTFEDITRSIWSRDPRKHRLRAFRRLQQRRPPGCDRRARQRPAACF